MKSKVALLSSDQFNTNRIIASALLTVGIVSVVVSAFFASTILAIIGLGLTFWGAVLLYIAPSKHVPVELLSATVTSPLINIEKMLLESNLNGKGVYLPPKYLKDFESSLVFIASKSEQNLPTPEEVQEEKLYSKNPKGVYLTPPGLALSKLFEKELGFSFTKRDLNYAKERLPKLLIEGMEIADDVRIEVENSSILVELTNNVFFDVCQETRKLEKTHELVGCSLSSAIACALAKAAGKPITIEKEEETRNGKTTRIQYNMLEE